jgi:hypothetical protein
VFCCDWRSKEKIKEESLVEVDVTFRQFGLLFRLYLGFLATMLTLKSMVELLLMVEAKLSGQDRLVRPLAVHPVLAEVQNRLRLSVLKGIS